MSTIGLCLGALLACGAPPAPVDATPPNIVMIISDDQGYGDFGFMGSETIRTPNLDALAASGTVFSHGYSTASTCRPAMRSLLTGLETIQWWARSLQLKRSGVRRGFAKQIQDFETLPGRLASVGYRSFQAGKFWEATYALAGFTHGMQEEGDNSFWGSVDAESLGRPSIEPVQRFIETHGQEPFFLWFAPKLPHVPHDASAELVASYPENLSYGARRYYANVTRFDQVVGELIETLERHGLRERTLIVFLIDNGWDQGPTARRRMLSIRDGDRGKGTVYEIGFRTPILFAWPGRVPAGKVDASLVSTVDLIPTLLDFAGAPALADRPGINLRSRIETGDGPKRDSLAGWVRAPRAVGKHADPSQPSAFTLRKDDWRYVWYPRTDHQELHDLRQDPRQENDLSTDRPEVTRQLREIVIAWRDEMGRAFGLPGRLKEEIRLRKRETGATP